MFCCNIGLPTWLLPFCDLSHRRNADGLLAVSTKINEYEVDENGVRKAK